MLTAEINTPITLVFPEGSLSGPYPVSLTLTLVHAGGNSTVVAPATEVGSGILQVTITPTQLGLLHVVSLANEVIIASIDVLPQSLSSTLESLKDAAYGSWQYNKVTGVLTLYSRQGDALYTYAVVDTTGVSSRSLE
jgi:hypothetical protein